MRHSSVSFLHLRLIISSAVNGSIASSKKSMGRSIDTKPTQLLKGFHQHEGVDCDETFTPVTIRTILAIVVSFRWPIHQLHVKMPFFMAISQKFPWHNPLNLLISFGLTMYVKQVLRRWFQLLKNILQTLDFSSSHACRYIPPPLFCRARTILSFLLLFLLLLIVSSP